MFRGVVMTQSRQPKYRYQIHLIITVFHVVLVALIYVEKNYGVFDCVQNGPEGAIIIDST